MASALAAHAKSGELPPTAPTALIVPSARGDSRVVKSSPFH